jgi:hypothetical protein
VSGSGLDDLLGAAVPSLIWQYADDMGHRDVDPAGPYGSDIYGRNFGTVDMDDSLLENVSRDISVFPMNECAGGGEPYEGSSDGWSVKDAGFRNF